MGRIFVKNDKEKWNIYSTITNDFLCDDWLTYEQLEEELCEEAVKKVKEDMTSLLTDNPRMTVMNYDEAMQMIRENSQEYLREQDETTEEKGTQGFHI